MIGFKIINISATISYHNYVITFTGLTASIILLVSHYFNRGVQIIVLPFALILILLLNRQDIVAY